MQPVDKTKLLSKLREIESKHGIRCAVLTVKTTQGMNIRDYAQSVQDQYFANAPKGSILMVISMDNRKWHITTDKTMRTKIIDDVVTGDLKDGAGAVAAIISFLIGGGVKKGMIASMSNVTNAVEAGQYLKRDTFNLIGSNDRYLYTHTTVVPKAKSRDNDSGSSGGTGGHGGGGGSF